MSQGRPVAAVLAAAVLVSACANIDIDRRAANFDAATYDSDLSACRGGPAALFALNGLESAAIGSLYGLVNGARIGSSAGNADKGAIIGTIVGGLLGFGAGAYNAIDDHDAALVRCLRDKGYAAGAV